MTPSEFGLWISIANGLLTIGTVAYLAITAGSRDNSTALKKLADLAGVIEARVARLEADMRHLPDREMTHFLEKAIVEMKGQIAVMDERLKPISEMTHRVHERMFDEKGK